MDHDFEADVSVNKYKLDDACATHAGRYLHWARLLATAKTNSDRQENILKLTVAERSLAVRSQLEAEGLKITEGLVEARCTMDSVIKEAREALVNCKSEVYALEAGVKAMDHRKSELDNLTTLWSRNYYSLPEGAGLPKPTSNGDYTNDLRAGLNKGRKE